MKTEQELDQYEDHDTWLEMAKQDYVSFHRLRNEEQTVQQRKVRIIIYKPGNQIPLKQSGHRSGNGQGNLVF